MTVSEVASTVQSNQAMRISRVETSYWKTLDKSVYTTNFTKKLKIDISGGHTSSRFMLTATAPQQRNAQRQPTKSWVLTSTIQRGVLTTHLLVQTGAADQLTTPSLIRKSSTGRSMEVAYTQLSSSIIEPTEANLNH